MIRLIIFLAVLAAIALGVDWLIAQDSLVAVTWRAASPDALGESARQGYNLTGPQVVAALLTLMVVVILAFDLLRFLWRLPSRARGARGKRVNRKGFQALTRGIIAAGAGDGRAARKAASEAARLLPQEPLTLLLNAQVAQIDGDREGAQKAYVAMAEAPQTRLLGLRGLFNEARRQDDDYAAEAYAREALRLAALPWAGEAVVRIETGQSNWRAALETVDANARGQAIDAQTAERQRAVLETAIAQELELTDPQQSLKLARQAIKRASDLTPAVALAARLMSRQGQMKQASRLIEKAYGQTPHPELIVSYLNMRPGDSSADRAARARRLGRHAPEHFETRLMFAETALAMRDFPAARRAMAPLIGGDERPTVRACLMMAHIEDVEHGPTGRGREWLTRAGKAPRDPAWIADGVVSLRWAPASPVTGKLDAFRWATPVEQLGAAPAEPILAPVAQASGEIKILAAEAVAAPAPVPAGKTPETVVMEPPKAAPEKAPDKAIDKAPEKGATQRDEPTEPSPEKVPAEKT